MESRLLSLVSLLTCCECSRNNTQEGKESEEATDEYDDVDDDYKIMVLTTVPTLHYRLEFHYLHHEAPCVVNMWVCTDQTTAQEQKQGDGTPNYRNLNTK